MKFPLECLRCLLNQALSLAVKQIEDDHEKFSFFMRVLREIPGSIEESTNAPLVAGRIHRIFRDYTNNSDPYSEEKAFYNQKVICLESEFESYISNSENTLLAAIKLAAAGNIIDFGPIPDLEPSMVIRVIQETMNKEFPTFVGEQLLKDIEQANTLLYLGDNAGEIVLDKLLIKEIKKYYPELMIYFATRGKPVINDVTEQDAEIVGIGKYAHVINNGTDLPGTVLSECSPEFLSVFDQADVVIAKGQDDYESLVKDSKRIYFIFLCKCDYFEKKLGIGKHEIVLYCNK